ncbi:uncharacterized protein LOC135218054 [Macrobrachium nipponense]|uniref:uncharacterized protein LOC135218054 n=1 Tax=Macrobrachium nipponense TaxID=159736 RepID=UPI0030C87EB5
MQKEGIKIKCEGRKDVEEGLACLSSLNLSSGPTSVEMDAATMTPAPEDPAPDHCVRYSPSPPPHAQTPSNQYPPPSQTSFNQYPPPSQSSSSKLPSPSKTTVTTSASQRAGPSSPTCSLPLPPTCHPPPKLPLLFQSILHLPSSPSHFSSFLLACSPKPYKPVSLTHPTPATEYALDIPLPPFTRCTCIIRDYETDNPKSEWNFNLA